MWRTRADDRAAYLSHTQWRPPEELSFIQAGLLRRAVESAYAESKFWRARLDACNIHPSRVRGVEALSALPPLDRDTAAREGLLGPPNAAEKEWLAGASKRAGKSTQDLDPLGPVLFTCSAGATHVSMELVVVEVVEGRLVASALHRPLLRFDTGRSGALAPAGRCACGRGLARLV
jgi:phenylacetate-coenzyme A ligase PaaK-like adenylate-forming protein